MADLARTKLIKRFKALPRNDQQLVLGILSNDERNRFLALLVRPSTSSRAPQLSPWLAKHLAQINDGKESALTPKSRELLNKTLANRSEPA